MSSPQKENGYTPIAHELFEAFYRCKLVEYERVVMMAIWRKTYGWGKKEDWVSNSQLSSETGIPRSHITRTIKQLFVKKLIKKSGKKISVNKCYDEWLVEWRKLPHQVTKVTSPGNKKLPHQVPTKEKKENIQKKDSKAVALADVKDENNAMGWNKQSDDFEEQVINYDGDGTPEPVKKKITRKYPNAPAVRKIFFEVLKKNPANWKINKNQLQACENLYTERGLEKIKNALEFYKENQTDTYCPDVSSPFKLDAKYADLSKYKTKKYGY